MLAPSPRPKLPPVRVPTRERGGHAADSAGSSKSRHSRAPTSRLALNGSGEHGSVQFGSTRIRYTVLRTSRQKTVAIGIDATGGVVLRAPADTPLAKLDTIVHRKARWILERLKRTSDLPPAPARREFVSGETFLYLGRQYRLKVCTGSNGVSLARGLLVASVPGPRELRAALIAWYRARAEERLPLYVAEWAPKLEVPSPEILVRDQRKRWGSCDAQGVLRFNWRILQAPRRLVEYVVAHELVHLVHRDHTPAFWQRFGRGMPDYEARRLELRAMGARMLW